MKPTAGRVVLFTFDEQSAAEANRRRTTGASIFERLTVQVPDGDGNQVKAWPAGAQAHIGNVVSVGDIYPAFVVRVWTDSCLNLQVFLDGNDVYWATSVVEGTAPRTWHWPERA